MQKYNRIFVKPDQIYTNHNGSRYRCKTTYDDGAAIMERISDGWTLLAHGIYMYDDGTIEWDYSTGGNWPYAGLKLEQEDAPMQLKTGPNMEAAQSELAQSAMSPEKRAEMRNYLRGLIIDASPDRRHELLEKMNI